MKEKGDCKIVQDLLPNYIEKLTSEETNIFIEEHLKNCDECKKVLENMKNDFKVIKIKRDNRDIKYAKKFNSRMRLIKIIAFLTLITAVVSLIWSYLYVKNEYVKMKTSFEKSVEIVTSIVKEGMYPETFYATIEEIYDSKDISGIKVIKVKGLDINEKDYRGKYGIQIYLDNLGDNFKIRFNGKDISIDNLKVGQNVAIYNYGHRPESEECDLDSVRMITVIDDIL